MAVNFNDPFWNTDIHITCTQWGDSGKGKLVDLASQRNNLLVIKTNGGANAGHTVTNEYGEFKFHLVPSGIFNPNAVCVIGQGVVLDPVQFVEELKEITDKRVPIAKCFISDKAHMVMPWHRVRDSLREAGRGKGKIGTTGRGIGPTYSDRVNRDGLRVGDLLKDNFSELFKETSKSQKQIIKAMNDEIKDEDLWNDDQVLAKIKEGLKVLRPMIVNAFQLIQEQKAAGKLILGEAGQGALLDLDFGSYPFVTSSHPGKIGYIISTSLEPRAVLGSLKAYITRVGEGPMPTELNDSDGEKLREIGHEYGATTGRPRRCGWLDLVVTEYGVRTAGITDLALMKLDVLDDFENIKVCVAYKVNDKEYNKLWDLDAEFMSHAEPIYETLSGWKQSTTDIRNFDDLPENAKRYVRFLEEKIGKPIRIVSVGPNREQTIFKD